MGVIFNPVSDEDADVANWTGVPVSTAGLLYQNLDDTHLLPADDTSYITTGGPAAVLAVFGFDYPDHYTLSDYGDGTTPVTRMGCTSVILHARCGNFGITSGLTVRSVARRDGMSVPETSGLTDISVPFGSYAEVSWTLTTDPITGGAWTLDNLRQTSFGVQQIATVGGELTRISRIWILVNEHDWPGGKRARLGPSQQGRENAYFCVICSTPKFRSDLIKVEHPLHPNYGQLVCKDDFDRSIEVEEDALLGSSPVEGDFDSGDDLP